MLPFVGNGKTMFAFEDPTRVGVSDNNFTDLIFSIDAQVAAVPPDVNPVPYPPPPGAACS